MTPNTDRPAATAIGDKVHVFVGGAHQVMTVVAAESLNAQIAAAVAAAKGHLHTEYPTDIGNANNGEDA